jgi:hypothetical protein
MWEFKVQHVAGKRNIIADALSRRPEPEGWEPPVDLEEDVEEFINKQLSAMTLSNPAPVDQRYLAFAQEATTTTTPVPESLVTTEFQMIAGWLTSMQNPRGLSRSELRKLRKRAL